MLDLTEDHNGDVRRVPVCFRGVPDFGVNHRRRKAIKRATPRRNWTKIHQIVTKENVPQQPIERVSPSVILSTHPAPAHNRRQAGAVIVRQSER